jgi:hypothetical protein
MSLPALRFPPRPVLCIAVFLFALPALGAAASWTTDDGVGVNEATITIDVTCSGDPTLCAFAGLGTPYSSQRTTGITGSGTAQLVEGGSFMFDLDTALTDPMVDVWTAELDEVTFDPLGNLGTPTLTNTFIFGQTGGPLPVPGLVFGAFGPTAMTQTMLSMGMVVTTTGLTQNFVDEPVGPALEAVNGSFEMLDATNYEIQNFQVSETGQTSYSTGGATVNFVISVSVTMNLSGQLVQETPDPDRVVATALCGDVGHYAWVRDPDGPNPNIAYRNCTVGGSCSSAVDLVAAGTEEAAPSVGCDGSTVLVAWEDNRNGNSDIAYRRSVDAGTSFAPLEFLAQGPAEETRPQVAMSSGVVLVAWEDTRRGNLDLAYRRSTDGGASFGTFGFLVRSGSDDFSPVVGLDGSGALLAWVDTRYGNQDIAYRRSADAGATWQPLTFLVKASTVEKSPTVAVDGMIMMIGWSDLRNGNQDLAYRRSSDSGASFAGLTFLVKAPTDDSQPFIGAGDLNGVLAWVDERDGNKNISYRRSSDGGASFGATSRLVAAGTDEYSPVCDVWTSLATCAWADTRDGGPKPHVRESNSGGIVWDPRFELDP